MHDRLRALLLAGTALLLGTAPSARTSAAEGAPATMRILLLPLDDRPPCLQWPVRLGAIAGIEVVTPPRELLGAFTTPGRPDALVKWMRQQDLSRIDAVIVALDMLAYGGLVASRLPTSSTLPVAVERLQTLRELRRRAPRLLVLGQSVGMRLAPTADGTNESYRVALARWAEIAPATTDTTLGQEARLLETRIPAPALADYRAARARNHFVNIEAIRLLRDRTLDFLVLSQDDARSRGLHVAELQALRDTISASQLEGRVSLQPGTDEVAMLLVARALGARVGASVSVRPVYSDTTARHRIMPFEDQALQETVRLQIRTAGARLAADSSRPAMQLFVFTSRGRPLPTRHFVDAIEAAEGGRIVADVDPVGNVQGADSSFTEELVARGRVGELDGYAAWNTAGNAIGTALAQGLVHQLAATGASQTAQHWFLVNRIVDDYAYHTRIRPRLVSDLGLRGGASQRLEIGQADGIEQQATASLEPAARRFATAIASMPCDVHDFVVHLPWRRLFEVELAYKLACRAPTPDHTDPRLP